MHPHMHLPTACSSQRPSLPCTHVHAHECMHAQAHACAHTRVYACTPFCTYEPTNVRAHMLLCTYIQVSSRPGRPGFSFRSVVEAGLYLFPHHGTAQNHGLCVRACVHACVYVGACVRSCACMCPSERVCARAYMCAHVHVRLHHVCVQVCMCDRAHALYV